MKHRFCGIEMSLEEYDDQLAIRAYVKTHCWNLLTPLERRATASEAPLTSTLWQTADINAAKFRMAYEAMEQRDGHVDDKDLIEACKIPLERRIENITDRLLVECFDQLNLNRCSDCERLVRTPLAKQCLWCGHDWHDRN